MIKQKKCVKKMLMETPQNRHWADQWYLYVIPVVLMLALMLFQLYVITNALDDDVEMPNVLERRLWSTVMISAAITFGVTALAVFYCWRRQNQQQQTYKVKSRVFETDSPPKFEYRMPKNNLTLGLDRRRQENTDDENGLDPDEMDSIEKSNSSDTSSDTTSKRSSRSSSIRSSSSIESPQPIYPQRRVRFDTSMNNNRLSGM